MSDLVSKEDYKGYTVEIHYDFDPLNPREDFDGFGKMVCFHKRYDLGDKHNLSVEETQEIYNSDKYFALPLYLYDHSGITMSTSPFHCPWDSGQVGIIYISKEQVRKEFSCKKITKEIQEKVYKNLAGEVETYDAYLTGQVFGYVIKDELGEDIESCWGFIGEEDYCLSEAKSTVDYLVKNKQEFIKEHEFDNHFGLA